MGEVEIWREGWNADGSKEGGVVLGYGLIGDGDVPCRIGVDIWIGSGGDEIHFDDGGVGDVDPDGDRLDGAKGLDVGGGDVKGLGVDEVSIDVQVSKHRELEAGDEVMS